MWNMCVTCGAWLALHLWDEQSHSFDATLLVHVLLPVYRSIAKFFLEYMFLGVTFNVFYTDCLVLTHFMFYV
jgi:hypothetical protein